MFRLTESLSSCLVSALLAWVCHGQLATAAIPSKDVKTIDLKLPAAKDQWLFTDSTGTIGQRELVLDGRKRLVSAFLEPYEWEDVSLKASFRVDPQEQGVLACGLIVRAAADGSAYYYVHFDRDQAILVRADKSNDWNEIARVGGLNKPAGEWHTAELTCIGNAFTVSLNGKELFEASDGTLARGRIGFYGSQGVAHVKDIVVARTPLQPQQKLVLPRPDYVTVCHDGGAGGYEAFPDLCRLKDGRLMCIVYASYHHIGLPKAGLPNGGRIVCCLSSDEGRTWSVPEVLFDGPEDDRDPSIVQLKNGRLICSFFQLRRNADRSLPCPDPYREPYTALGTWIVTSDDAGKTWSEPQSVAADYYVSSPIRELSTGRLVIPLYSEKGGAAFGAVCTSDDGGKTWSKPINLDNGGKTLDAETDVIETKSGTLYAAMRGSSCPMHFVTSSDNGTTWSSAAAADFIAHSPYLHRTTDGDIVLGYRQITDHMNTALRISRDGCQTWSKPMVIDEVIGAYPSMVNLGDGSTLVVYYEEGEGSNIRARRFRIDDGKVRFLPLVAQ